MAGIARNIAFTISENREQDVYVKYGNVSLPSITANSFSTARTAVKLLKNLKIQMH
jgi:hypothetical protein